VAPAGAALTVAALGVVFGDIGTSPLYALQAVFATEGITVDQSSVHGVISLVFWTITIVVSIKYVTFVLHADNRGEGGIMALIGLVERSRLRSKSAALTLVAIGLAGAALFYGDGMITPAISVLSAVEGLEVVSPSLEHLVLPLTLAILTALFAIQRFGTGSVGRWFGPVTAVWFLALGGSGLAEVIQHPKILEALAPSAAVTFMFENWSVTFLALASVVLVVTGAEALYADLGHFGLPPIRRAWFFLVFPALTLQYLGQGSLILRSPGSLNGTLFLLFPDFLRLPMIGLATAAVVIASQALISGAFSISRQADQMGFVPRLAIRHTSTKLAGQVYIPSINWILFVGVVVIVVGFGSSASLASAYGIAVTGTFIVTTVLFATVARKLWEKPRWMIIAGLAIMLPIDFAFFSANLTKIEHGGWLPLAIGLGIYTLLRTWQKGRAAITIKRRAKEGSMREFIESIHWDRLKLQRVPGTAIFLNATRETVPLALRTNAELNHVLQEQVIVVTVQIMPAAFYDQPDRVVVNDLGYRDDGISHVTGRYGFREEPDIPALLRQADGQSGIQLTSAPEDCAYFVSSINIARSGEPGMSDWRKRLFIHLRGYASNPAEYFNLPPERTVTVGARVEL
jgi:KUP system potassium uptake protein